MRHTLLILMLLAGPLFAQSAKSPDPKPKVVFVCEHGAAKSIIAAAEFSRAAKAQGLEVRVIARGTNPDNEIPAYIREGLKADHSEPANSKPIKVTKDDLSGAARIISFGPDVRPLLVDGASVADWSATPSPSENYSAARDYIRKRVDALVQELKKK